jgi:hypothetical protein
MAAAQDVFSAIPPELQRLTCTFVSRQYRYVIIVNIQKLSKADLKATRLVNKAWSTVAATVLWSQMEIDLDDIDQRKFDALLNSNVGGILDNVKELIISTDSDDLSQKSKQRATMNLLGLMAALPHNCLTVFRIKRFKLDAEVLALILCTQSQLTRLQMWLCAKTPGRLPNTNFARGNLSNLHSLCIHIDGSRNETYEGFGAWVLHAHKLRDLEIVGESSPTTSQFNGWTLPTHALPITLHRLVLKRLQFSDMAENLVTTLQLFDLRTLIIRFCKNIGPLLRSLATRFKQTDTISLRKLYILNFVLPEDTCRDLEYLVESVQGVTDLALGATHEGGLSRLRCLGSTGKTLQTLELHAGSQEKTYSAREIKQLTTYCPDLKILALSIGDLNPTINSMEVLDPLRICTLNHYVETLVSY